MGTVEPDPGRLRRTHALPDGRRGLPRGVDDHHEPARLDRTAAALGRGRRPGGSRRGVSGAGGGAAGRPQFLTPIAAFFAARGLVSAPEAGVRCRRVPAAMPFEFPFLPAGQVFGSLRDDLRTQGRVPRQHTAVDDLVRPSRRHDRYEAGHELFRREPQRRRPDGGAGTRLDRLRFCGRGRPRTAPARRMVRDDAPRGSRAAPALAGPGQRPGGALRGGALPQELPFRRPNPREPRAGNRGRRAGPEALVRHHYEVGGSPRERGRGQEWGPI